MARQITIEAVQAVLVKKGSTYQVSTAEYARAIKVCEARGKVTVASVVEAIQLLW